MNKNDYAIFKFITVPTKWDMLKINIYKKLSYRWQTARRVWRSVKVTKCGTILYVRYGFLSVSYSNFVRKTVFEIFDFKNVVTLKTGSRVREGHW